MVKVLRIRYLDIFTVYKLLNSKIGELGFYSDFKEGIFKYIINRQCYFFANNGSIAGLLLLNPKNKEIHYIPLKEKGLSLFRLIYTLNTNFNLSGYALSIKHKSLNPGLYSRYFPVVIYDNYKYMYINIDNFSYRNFNYKENLVFRKMIINKEEPLRVKLQNNIFNNSSSGRRELTLLEVYNEESRSSFLKDMCYILEAEGNPSGYGQIIIADGENYLVNFGVIIECRKKGYGRYFLSKIIEDCKAKGINKLYLCVDNNNLSAVKLYREIGFNESINNFILRFR